MVVVTLIAERFAKKPLVEVIEIPFAVVNVRPDKVVAPNTCNVPDALTFPEFSTKNNPERFDVDVAIERPVAVNCELFTPSVTVMGVVKLLLVAEPLLVSTPQRNLPVVASYKRLCDSKLQSASPVWKNPPATVEVRTLVVAVMTKLVPYKLVEVIFVAKKLVVVALTTSNAPALIAPKSVSTPSEVILFELLKN